MAINKKFSKAKKDEPKKKVEKKKTTKKTAPKKKIEKKKIVAVSNEKGRPKQEVSFGKSVVVLIAQQRLTDEQMRQELEKKFPNSKGVKSTDHIKWYRSRMNQGKLPHLGYKDLLTFNEKYRAVKAETDGRKNNGSYKKKAKEAKETAKKETSKKRTVLSRKKSK